MEWSAALVIKWGTVNTFMYSFLPYFPSITNFLLVFVPYFVVDALIFSSRAVLVGLLQFLVQFVLELFI